MRFVRVLWIVGGLAAAVALIVTYHQQRQLEAHTKVIEIELQQDKRNLHRITELASASAAAICLEAFAPTQRARIAIVVHFVETGGGIDVTHLPICEHAAHIAINAIVQR